MLNLGKLSICIYEEEKRRIVSPGSQVQSLDLFCHHLHCLSNFGFSSHPDNKSSAGVLYFCHLKHGVCGVGALSMMSWIILMIMFSTYFQMLHRKNNCQVLQYEFNILTQSEKKLSNFTSFAAFGFLPKKALKNADSIVAGTLQKTFGCFWEVTL